MSFDYVVTLLPRMLAGTLTTLYLLFAAFLLGNALAILTALARISSRRALQWPSWAYIQVIRGTPLLVQIYLFYYGLGSILAHVPAVRFSLFWPLLRDGFWYAVVALGISTGAYSGEILRGALMAVPRGEVEAARALGLRPRHITWLVLIPRAIQSCLPALGGETILLLKSTALASTVTVLDMMGQANFARAQSLRVYEPLLLAALIYILLTIGITRLFALAEARANRGAGRMVYARTRD